MNNTALLILAGAAVGLVAIYFYDTVLAPTPEGFQPYNSTATTYTSTPTVYQGVKMQLQMYPGATPSQEIEILQKYINLYQGRTVVNPTGIFDDATAKIIKEITGKSVTTLHEFRFMYMATRGLNAEADKIIKGNI